MLIMSDLYNLNDRDRNSKYVRKKSPSKPYLHGSNSKNFVRQDVAASSTGSSIRHKPQKDLAYQRTEGYDNIKVNHKNIEKLHTSTTEDGPVTQRSGLSKSYDSPYKSPFNPSQRGSRYMSSYLSPELKYDDSIEEDSLEEIERAISPDRAANVRKFKVASMPQDSLSDRRLSYGDKDYFMAKKSQSNIIASFQELQMKVKSLERLRFQAIEEKDSILRDISEKKRELMLWKNKQNFDITNNLLSSRSDNNRLRRECDELEKKISNEDMSRMIAQETRSSETVIHSLTQDVNIRLKTQISALESKKRGLEDELVLLKYRSEGLENRLQQSLLAKNQELKNAVEVLERELEDVSKSNTENDKQIDSLKKYIQFIIDMNGDLCETLIAREESKANIIRLADKLSPPRYAWPKKVVIRENRANIEDFVKQAATAAALSKREKATKVSVLNKLNGNSKSDENLAWSQSGNLKSSAKSIETKLTARPLSGKRNSRRKTMTKEQLLELQAASAVAAAATADKAFKLHSKRRVSESGV